MDYPRTNAEIDIPDLIRPLVPGEVPGPVDDLNMGVRDQPRGLRRRTHRHRARGAVHEEDRDTGGHGGQSADERPRLGRARRTDAIVAANAGTASSMSGIGGAVGRIREVRRPDQAERLHRLLGRRRARLLLRFDLLHPRPLLVGQGRLHPLAELLHHLDMCSERVDDDRTGDPLRTGDEHVQRQVPAPRMPDDPGPPADGLVDHRRGVGDVRLDRERLADGRRQQPPLLVQDRGEGAGQELHERVEVVRRHARAAVKQHHRKALAAEPPGLNRALRRP